MKNNKSDKKNKIANQNNLNDIINSTNTDRGAYDKIINIIKYSLEQFNDVLTIITSISGNVLILKNHIEIVKNAIDSVYGQNGVMGTISQATQSISTKSGLTIDSVRNSSKILDIQLNEILRVIERIIKISKKGRNIKKEGMERVTLAFEPLQQLSHFLDSFKISPVDAIKLDLLTAYLLKMRQQIFPSLQWLSTKSFLIINRRGLADVFKMLSDVSISIENIAMTPKAFSNLLLYIKALDLISKIISRTKSLALKATLMPKFLTNRIVYLFNVQLPSMFKSVDTLSFIDMETIIIKLKCFSDAIDVIAEIYDKITKKWYKINRNKFKGLGKISKGMSLGFKHIFKKEFKSGFIVGAAGIKSGLKSITNNVFHSGLFKDIPIIYNLLFTKAIINIVLSISADITKSMSAAKILLKIGKLKFNTFIGTISTIRNISDLIFKKFGKTYDTKVKTWGGRKLIVKNLIETTIIIYTVSLILKIIDKIPFILMGKRLIILMKNLDLLKELIIKIMKIFGGKTLSKYFVDWKNVKIIIKNILLSILITKLISVLMYNAAIAGVGAMLFLVPGLALMGAFKIIIEIIKIVNHIRIPSYANVLKKFLLLSAVFGMLTIIGISLLTLSLVAIPVLNNIPALLLFMAALIPLGGLLIGVGWVFAIAASGSMFAVAGLGMMTLMILAITTIAYELKLLEHIELDVDLIKENVRTVLDIARSITDSLFENDDLDNAIQANAESDNWLDMLKNTIFGSALPIKALAGSFILLMTFVSVVLITMTIAVLKILEYVKLDEKKIKNNVNSILDLSHFIIDVLFGSAVYDPLTGETYKKYSGESWVKKIFSGAGDIINVILASATLLFTGLSVTMILLTALALTALANVKLDTAAIKNNVDEIINTAKYVMELVRQPADNFDNTDDGILGKLLRWLLPNNILDTIDAIIATGYTAYVLISVYLVNRIAKNLQKIANIKDEELATAEQKAASVIISSKNILASVSEISIKKDDFKDSMKNIRRAKRLVRNLIGLSKVCSKLVTEQKEQPQITDENVNQMIDVIMRVSYMITQANLMIDENKGLNNINGKIKNIKMLFNNLNNMLDAISTEKFNSKRINGILSELDNSYDPFLYVIKYSVKYAQAAKDLKISNAGIKGHHKAANKIIDKVNDLKNIFDAVLEMVDSINNLIDVDINENITTKIKLIKTSTHLLLHDISTMISGAYEIPGQRSAGNNEANKIKITVKKLKNFKKQIEQSLEIIDSIVILLKQIDTFEIKTDVNSKINSLLSAVDQIVISLFSEKNSDGQITHVLNNKEIKNKVKNAKNSKKYLRPLTNSMEILNMIIDTLKRINNDNFKIDSDTINTKIASIFNVADNIIKLVTNEKNEKNEITDTLLTKKEIRDKVKKSKQSKKFLNPINDSIVIISSIIETIEKIKGFTVDIDYKTKISDVLEVANGIIDTLFAEEITKKDGRIVKNNFNKKEVKDKIKKAKKSGKFLEPIKDSLQIIKDIIESLKTISEFEIKDIVSNDIDPLIGPPNPKSINDKIIYIFDMANNMIDALFTETIQKRNGKIKVNSLNNKEVRAKIRNAKKSGKFLEPINDSMAIIGSIVDTLKNINDFTIEDNINDSIIDILEIANNIIDALFTEEVQKRNGKIVKNCLSNKEIRAKIKNAKNSNEFLAPMTDTIGIIKDIINNLNTINEFEINSVKSLTAGDGVGDNKIKEIITYADNVTSYIYETITQSANSNTLSIYSNVNLDDRFSKIYNAVDFLKKISNIFNTFNDEVQFTIDTKKSVAEKYNNVLNCVVDINANKHKIKTNNIKKLQKVDYTMVHSLLESLHMIGLDFMNLNEFDETKLDNSSNIINKLLAQINTFSGFSKGLAQEDIRNGREIISNYNKFIEKIGNTDLSNLSTATNMFKHMSEFSATINGNFDELADALVNKIAPVLEEVKELLDKIPEKIDSSASNISSSIYDNSQNKPTNPTVMAQQVQREKGGKATEEEINNIVDQRIRENVAEKSNSVEVKIDELIDLLRSGQIQIRLG